VCVCVCVCACVRRDWCGRTKIAPCPCPRLRCACSCCARSPLLPSLLTAAARRCPCFDSRKRSQRTPCPGNLTLPNGARVSSRQEYLYLCDGWSADLRFLAGSPLSTAARGQAHTCVLVRACACVSLCVCVCVCVCVSELAVLGRPLRPGSARAWSNSTMFAPCWRVSVRKRRGEKERQRQSLRAITATHAENHTHEHTRARTHRCVNSSSGLAAVIRKWVSLCDNALWNGSQGRCARPQAAGTASCWRGE